MPGTGAERNAATSAALFTPVTTPEQGAGAKTSPPEGQSSSDDDENPSYPEVVDVESISSGELQLPHLCRNSCQLINRQICPSTARASLII